MFEVKRNFEEIIKRHQEFISCRDVKSPLFCVNVAGRNYAKAYANTFKNIKSNREVLPDDIAMDDFIKDVETFICWNEELDSDFFYPVAPYLFIPWMEAIIGCPIFAGRDSFYAEPFIKDWSLFSGKVDLSNNNKWLCKLIEMTSILAVYLDGRYPMASSTHLRGPADMMAAALGQKEFPLELYDNPDKLKKMCTLFSETFVNVARTVNNIVKKSKFKGYTSNLFGIWTEGICQFFQDDALAFLSPKFYKELILESHILIDNSFSSTLYHLHPVSIFAIDELIKFKNLKIIEVNIEPEAIGPSTQELIPHIKKIQDSGKAVILCFTDIDFTPDFIAKETETACKNLSYKGLCINVVTADVKDGEKKMEAMKESFN